MKDSDKHIDELFKKLENDSFQVPQSFLDDLNTRLDAQLVQNKRRKPFFWIFFGMFTLAIIGVLSYCLLDNTSDPDLQLSQVQLNSTNSKDDSRKIKKPSSKIYAKKNTVQIKVENQLESVQDRKEEKESKIEVNRIQKSHKVIVNSQKNRSKSKFNSPSKGIMGKLQHHSNEKNEVLTFDDSLLSSSSGTHIENKFDLHIQMKSKPVQFVDLELQLVREQNGIIDQNNAETIEDSKPWQFDIQLYGGFSQAYWKMKPSLNDSNYTSLGRTPIWSPSFGIKGNVFYNNINASIGLEYYQSNEKLELTSKVIQQVDSDSTFLGYQYDTIYVDSFTWYIDSNEYYQINPIYDSVQVKENIKNTYAWFSIPVSFGYRFKINSWSIIPRAGVNLNFGIAENKGRYPSSNFGSNQYDAVRFNLDLMIQTEIRKDFNKFHLFLTPYYRGNLMPMLKSQQFNISHQGWGINIGAGFTF